MMFQRVSVRQDDLRTKIKKTIDLDRDIKSNNFDGDSIVKYTKPKYEMETDEEILIRQVFETSYKLGRVKFKYILTSSPISAFLILQFQMCIFLQKGEADFIWQEHSEL